MHLTLDSAQSRDRSESLTLPLNALHVVVLSNPGLTTPLCDMHWGTHTGRFPLHLLQRVVEHEFPTHAASILSCECGNVDLGLADVVQEHQLTMQVGSGRHVSTTPCAHQQALS